MLFAGGVALGPSFAALAGIDPASSVKPTTVLAKALSFSYTPVQNVIPSISLSPTKYECCMCKCSCQSLALNLGLDFKNLAHSQNQWPTVKLQYPYPEARETFALVYPKNAESYDPMAELATALYTIFKCKMCRLHNLKYVLIFNRLPAT
jgi:hypothetical protein